MGVYIGLMSGTSVDAIDAVLVDLDARPPCLIAHHSHAIAPSLRAALLGAVHEDKLRAVLDLDVLMGRRLASAAIALLDEAAVDAAAVAAIGSHGQTIIHCPEGDTPHTLQIGDPNIIAELTGICTVADFRRRDIAAGGQGAPLAPAYHEVLFRDPARARVVLNLGGIANVTILPVESAAPVEGFDTGPGNGLCDAWAERHQGTSFDSDARWAAGGSVVPDLLSALLDDGYFAQRPPKSTGKASFDLEWVAHRAGTLLARYPARDVQRTLVELTVCSIRDALESRAAAAEELLVCGGGVHNPLIMRGLAEHLPHTRVLSTAHYGVDPDFLEAEAFAWLARQRLQGKPGNLPSVTGASHPVVLGTIHAPAIDRAGANPR